MSSPRRSVLENSLISIGKLSELAGLTKDTLRYYEECGLIQPKERTESNYRQYDPQDSLRRLAFIKKAQSLNFNLSEIKKILEAGTPVCCIEVKALLAEKIEKLELELLALQGKKEFLKAVQQGWESPAAEQFSNDDLCPLIDNL